MDQKTLEDLVRKYPCFVLPEDDEGRTAITCPVQLQFVWLEKMRTNKDDPNAKPRYTLAGIIPSFADTSALDQIAQKAWVNGPHVSKRGKPKSKPLKPQSQNAEKYEGFGNDGVYFDAATINAVEIYDANMQKVPADQVKPGHYARIKIRAYSFDKNGNWGVSFGLQSLQLVDTSEVFAVSNSGRASDGFEAMNAPKGNGPAQMPAQSNGASTFW